MTMPSTFPLPPMVAAESRSRAFLRILSDMCREDRDLRSWMLEDFGRNKTTRANFERLVDGTPLPGDLGSDGFAALSGELDAWLEERKSLKRTIPSQAIRPYGGRTYQEIETLIRKYESRALEFTSFSLARDWRKAGKATKASPNLLVRLADLLDAATASGDVRRIHALGKAVALLGTIDPERPKSLFGYAEWWKVNALVYMLRNPRESYKTRDVRAHLKAIGSEISSLDFRRFCRRHGIARDQKAGRPKKQRRD